MKIMKDIDIFGEKFSFNYNGYDKYSTKMGGFIFLIFIIVAMIFFVNSFISFYNRKNYSLQFYTINDYTEQIMLNNNFIFGIDCNKKRTEKAYELFEIIVEYYFRVDGNINNIEINHENCKENYFQINNFNNIMHNINITNYKCTKTEKEIEGIYTDKKFLYYKITVVSNKKENITNIKNFFEKNECKFQFYYIDYIFDLDNYSNPIEPILNSLFIQINPEKDTKKNVFFIKYHFKNEDKLIDFPFSNSEEENVKVGFSRTEDYDIENETLNENKTKNYTTLYLRADNKKTKIIRKYQNLLDFYAESTSFWIGIFESLNFFFTIYKGFLTKLSMSKKLFFFAESSPMKNPPRKTNRIFPKQKLKKIILKIITMNKKII